MSEGVTNKRVTIAKYTVAFTAFALLWSFGYGGKVRSTRIGMDALIAEAESEAALDWFEEQANAASGLNNEANTLMRGGNLDAAIVAYGEAIELRKALLSKGWDPSVATDLAASYRNRAIALRMKEDLASTMADLDESIRLQSQLLEEEQLTELRPELARSLSLRSSALASRGKVEEALEDLNQAISLQTERVEQAWDDSIARVAEELAKNHVSRSRLHSTEGRASLAIEDTEAAITLQTRLIDKHGRANLMASLTKNLQAVAWHRATSPDAQLRNGKQALGYARIALSIRERTSPGLLATMAAACAETGDYRAAAQWQEQAIGLADEMSREAFRRALLLYQSGKPYRDELRRAP